jgi:hypothetical protein
MGLQVHSSAKKKLHDLETSSITHYIHHPQNGGGKATMFWDCEDLMLCEFRPSKNKNQQ